MSPVAAPTETSARVAKVRELMAAEKIDAVLVRSADRYLNEYVPVSESTRHWVTGFTGSMGGALIGKERAWLAVDGRYYLQADTETEGTPYTVERVPLGKAIKTALFELAAELAKNGAERIGYEPDRFSADELGALTRALEKTGVELVPTEPSLIERARGDIDTTWAGPRAICETAVGRTVAEKIALAAPLLAEKGCDCLLVQRLDALAYLTNLRGDDFPYQATYRAVGVLTPTKVIVATRLDAVSDDVRAARPDIEWVGEDGWRDALRELSSAGLGAVGYDKGGTTAAGVLAIEAAGAKAVELSCPVVAMKAKKTEAELASMQDAFFRADGVMEGAQAWLNEQLDAGNAVSELDMANTVARLFTESGATGLSFKVISAAGKNGAIIHYSTPDPERKIQPGELMPIDTGGYFAEGYATDLTRTFLAGSPKKAPKATAEQKRYFTAVLKGAIAGMSARMPKGARGDQLDAITRDPIWREGLNFAHGTGHGVGINVHEFPPRVAPNTRAPLEEGHVFSIEPGVYLSEFGGVRIENLCTVKDAADAPGFIDVVPLTFSDLDERLIEDAMLTDRERTWLADYKATRAARRSQGK